MTHCLRLVLGIALSLSGLGVQADAQISDFQWIDDNHMQQQIQRVDDLARTRVGSQVRGDSTDLDTLQRIIDRDLVDSEDSLTLQALGAVLGDVMRDQIEELEWKVYEDELGRSRALCLRDTQECLFPITMLSRRMEVGLKPDVRRIYDDALERIEPLLPEAPYGPASSRRNNR